jgi:hypothetical protein
MGIEFDPDSNGRFTDDVGRFPMDGAYVIDDLDCWVGDPLTLIGYGRRWSRRPGRMLIVTVPRYELGTDEESGIRWQAWCRSADVILEVRLVDGTDATLEVLSHRSGPVASIELDAMLHFAEYRNPRDRAGG